MKKLLFILTFLFIGTARSEVPTLPTLETSNINTVFGNLAAATLFRPVEPASTFGDVWGLSFGVVGSLNSAAPIGSITNTNTTAIPTGSIFVAGQFPLGLAIELGFFPSMTLSGATFNTFGIDAKWTMTKTVLAMLPFDVALRPFYSSAGLGYTQPQAGGTVTIDYAGKVWGLMAQASKAFSVIEPYIGLGFASQTSTLGAVGTANIFGSSYTVGTQSVTAGSASLWLQAGFQLKLSIITLSLEWDNMFGTNSGSAKFAFKI